MLAYDCRVEPDLLELDEPVEVAVETVVDPEAIEKARAEAVAEMQGKLDKAREAKKRAEDKQKIAEEALEQARLQLEEQALPDPEFPPGEMYIMGEYCNDMLGRYIVLYYGSFAALLADEDEETWKDEIFATVAHEFTHHMEDFAGLHALDDKDAEFLRQARGEE